MNVNDLAQRMLQGKRRNSGPQSTKAQALKAAVSEVLSEEARQSPMFKMALPALNLITSDSEVDTTIGMIETLLESYRRHLGHESE